MITNEEIGRIFDINATICDNNDIDSYSPSPRYMTKEKFINLVSMLLVRPSPKTIDGDWEIEYIYDSANKRYFQWYDVGPARVYIEDSTHEAQEKALQIASLISASPKLLDVVKRIREWHSIGMTTDNINESVESLRYIFLDMDDAIKIAESYS